MTSPPVLRRARTTAGRAPAPARPRLARLAVLLFHVAAPLPLRALHAVGAAAGTLAAVFPTRARRTARANVAIAFPDADAAARRRLARRALAHAGRALFELAALWMWPVDRALAVVRDVRGAEALDAARRRGRGVIVATAHLGSWEAGLLYMSRHCQPTTFARGPRMRELAAFVAARRARAGGEVVALDRAGVRRAIRTLRRGGVVIVAADQDPGLGAGVFVPFFGVPANTSMFVSRLAHGLDAAVVLAWSERLPRSGGVRLFFEDAPPAVRGSSAPDAAAALNRALETVIRTCPEQYLWSYDRFRIKPSGATAIGNRVS